MKDSLKEYIISKKNDIVAFIVMYAVIGAMLLVVYGGLMHINDVYEKTLNSPPINTITANITELYCDKHGKCWVKVDPDSVSAKGENSSDFVSDAKYDLKAQSYEFEIIDSKDIIDSGSDSETIDSEDITVSDSGKNVVKINTYKVFDYCALTIPSLNISQDLYNKIQNTKNGTDIIWQAGQ